MISPAPIRLITAVFLFLASQALAGPNIPAGDLVLRHDIQYLSDRGVIKGPVTTWPLAWGPILTDLREADSAALDAELRSTWRRVRDRAERETRVGKISFNVAARAAENPTRIRSFRDTPRGNAELSAGVAWFGHSLGVGLNVQVVDSDQDKEEVRFDDSLVGAVVGNWSFAASTQQRWWGPAWDGSLIFSNNARPIPSLVIDRVFTDAFETRWLNWIGPWDLSVIFGQMERDRSIPSTQIFGMRLNFRPFSSLEIGLSRTAQWCGDGRPCDASVFADLFLGRDNRGDGGINLDNEPGNQIAGVDIRWGPSLFGQKVAMYGQFMGEDEAGGFPSRWLGILGGEWSGYLFDRWSTRVYAEFAGTSCQFHESSELFNCAYNHGIYRTGYRFRSRSVGHGSDNDSRLVSLGAMMVNDVATEWRALLRYGSLNRGGPADVNNSLTPTRQDVTSVDLSNSRVLAVGIIDVGLGFEHIDDAVSGASSSVGRIYVQWRTEY